MSETTLKVRLQNAINTHAKWGELNPVLKNGEFAISSDRGFSYKVGNGTSKWSELQYNAASTLYGLNATVGELNYMDGVTSNVQTQLNGKAASGHNHDSAYLKLSGGRLTGVLEESGGSYVHNFNGTDGETGYVNFADITIKDTYVDQPIVFELLDRHVFQSVEVSVKFSGTNNTTPGLNMLTYRGSGLYTYIVKDSNNASLWHLYVKKPSGYNYFCVTRFHIGNYTSHKVTVAWTNVQADTLPDGYITAVLYNVASEAATATKATQDSSGQQINTTYIKGLSVSGRTITYTKGNGATGTITTQDTTYPFYNKVIDGSFTTAYRTQTKGNTASGNYISTIRNNTANVANSPQYGSGLAWGYGDTHGYLYVSYNTANAYIGGGNQDKLNWVKKISLEGHTHNYLPLGGGTLTGNLNFTGQNSISWNSDTYQQRIAINDDSETNTSVFHFQQSSNGGQNYTDLMTIKDNGQVVANMFVGSLSGNASTSSQVYSTTTNPSAGTGYYIPFISGASSGNKSLLNNNGLIYWTREGTTSSIGISELGLGNNVAKGTARNKKGLIYIYGESSGYTEIHPGNNGTGNISIILPSTSGTLSLNGHTHSQLLIQFNGADMYSYNGGATKTVNITPAAIGASATNHTHNYAGSSSAGGVANSALKWSTPRTITLNGAITGTVNIDGSSNVTLTTAEGNVSFKRMGQVDSSTDWNTLVDPGCYIVNMSVWGDAATNHSPNEYSSSVYYYGLLLVFTPVSYYRKVQIYLPHSVQNSAHGLVLIRMINNNGWNAWSPIFKGVNKWYVGLGNVENKSSATIRGELTSANVTTALGFTPANVNHGRHVPDYCTTITDWNNAKTNGWYMASNAANAPVANTWFFGHVIVHNAMWVQQTLYAFTDSTNIPRTYTRHSYDAGVDADVRTNWRSWIETTVRKAVPENAKFTDTWRGIQNNLTSDSTTDSLSAAQGKVLKGLVDGKAPASGSNNYVRVWNSNNVGNSQDASINDLAKQHFAMAMVNNATDNPTGAAKWVHAINMSWSNGSNANWVSQIALGVNDSNGMWYRTVQGSIAGKDWRRVLDSTNYNSYTVTKTGVGASGTWGINISGTAANASKVSNTLSINGKTYDGSAAVAVGTIGVAHGGTGQTTGINAANYFLNSLGTGGSTPSDADYYISQYAGGGTTYTTYHRRPVSALWSYMKNKISSVLKLTVSDYNGNSATASKLATPRTITLTGLSSGSAEFDGSGNITITDNGYSCLVNVGNSIANPYARIAHHETTSNWEDRTSILMISQNYNGGAFGILKLDFRTDSITTGANGSCSAVWLVIKGFALDQFIIKASIVQNNMYADLYYKAVNTYGSITVHQISGGTRTNFPHRGWTLENGALRAAMDIRSYTHTFNSVCEGYVATANKASKLATARTINGTSFDGTANITTANWGTSRTLTIGNTGKAVNGGGNVSWSLAEIGALPLTGGTVTGTLILSKTTDSEGTANNSPALIIGGTATVSHIEIDPNEINAKSNGTTVSQLNLNTNGGLVNIGSGGLKVNGALNVTGISSIANTINSSKTTQTYLAGNQGATIINSTASAGSYTMLAKMNSTNGYFTHGCYQNRYLLNYTAKSTVDAGTNSVTKSVILLDESGNSSFPGTVTATTFSGALSGNASTATYATYTTDVRVASSNPTSLTKYYIPFYSTSTNENYKGTQVNDGLIYQTSEGTAVTDGYGQAWLTLGNNIALGTAGNKQGIIHMYGSTSHYIGLTVGAPTANRTITFPDANGTVALTTSNVNSATKLKTSRTLTIGNTGKSFNGEANVSWSLAEIGALPLTGGTVTGEVKYWNADAFRLVNGKYGTIFRNDGYGTYILLTNENEAAMGGFNNLRPFRISNSSGLVTIGNGLTVNGNAVITGVGDIRGGTQIGYGSNYGWTDWYKNTTLYGSIYVGTSSGDNNCFIIRNMVHDIMVSPRNGNGSGITGFIGSITYTNSCYKGSSIRFKKNVIDISQSEANKLLSLKPVTFNYKNNNQFSAGLIAEDTEKYYPHTINKNSNGQVEGLDYIELIPYMIKKIQMQEKEISDLKSRLNSETVFVATASSVV